MKKNSSYNTYNDATVLYGIVASGVCPMNEVNAHRAQLVLEWVTIFGRVYHLGK